MKIDVRGSDTIKIALLPMGILTGVAGIVMLLAIGASAASAKPAPATADIVDVAIADGNFETLVTAVKTAGLVDTLKGEGPFTVFAPTDEAFAKIPSEQLKALLADHDQLTAVLLYHVVPGRVEAEDVVSRETLKTAEGRSVRIAHGEGVKINEARIIATDIMASNGVIHVIDAVILPQ